MPNRILKESVCTSDEIDRLSPFEETVFYRLIVVCDDYGRTDARPQVVRSRIFPLREELRSDVISDALRKLRDVGLILLYESDGRPYLQIKTWEKHQYVRAAKSKYPSPDSDISGVKAPETSDGKTTEKARDKGCVKASAGNCAQTCADSPVNENENDIYENENGGEIRASCAPAREREKPAAEKRTERTGKNEDGAEIAALSVIIADNSALKAENTDGTDTADKAEFAPPTLNEVKDYCAERGLKVSAERFFDYYTSNGWMIGGNRMANWRAAIRTWSDRSDDRLYCGDGGRRRQDVYRNENLSDDEFVAMFNENAERKRKMLIAELDEKEKRVNSEE